MLDTFKFHHIGVAVNNIEATTAIYVHGGYKQSETIFDPIQNVNICWLTKDFMPTIELLAPVDENSPINKILAKNGVIPYHICYMVADIGQAIKDLRRLKYTLVSKSEPAVAINNCNVCFLFNKHIGLIELVEEPANI